jgi:hypothetical protein
MKSLDQIEARTPISSLPFVISTPGSYYLTKSLNLSTGNAITINVSQVTLDLNGFTVSSTAASASGTAIFLTSGLTDITIFNGHIHGGFVNGIDYSLGTAPSGIRVSGVSVSNCQAYGINIGRGGGLDFGRASVVESCTVQTIGSAGIIASSVFHSNAYQCGINGIYAVTASDCYCNASGDAITAYTVNNCYGESSGGGYGVNAYAANNCVAVSLNSNAIHAKTATNCWGYSNSNRGISADIVISSYGTSGGSSYGIFATYIATNCYGSSGSGTGLSAVIANSCVGVNSSGPAVSYTYHYNMPP